VCDLPAEYADPIINYRNFIVLGDADTNDSGYYMDTEGGDEHCVAESASPVANFHAWKGRVAVDEEMEGVSSSVLAHESHVRTMPRYLEPSDAAAGAAARKKSRNKPRCPLIDDEAEHSGSEGDDRDDMDESDPTLGGFIVNDHVSEPGEDSDGGNDSDNSDVTLVDASTVRTRSGRDVQPPSRFDAMIEDGQHYRE
jgi:hypothetical protein